MEVILPLPIMMGLVEVKMRVLQVFKKYLILLLVATIVPSAYASVIKPLLITAQSTNNSSQSWYFTIDISQQGLGYVAYSAAPGAQSGPIYIEMLPNTSLKVFI